MILGLCNDASSTTKILRCHGMMIMTDKSERMWKEVETHDNIFASKDWKKNTCNMYKYFIMLSYSMTTSKP